MPGKGQEMVQDGQEMSVNGQGMSGNLSVDGPKMLLGTNMAETRSQIPPLQLLLRIGGGVGVVG